MKAQALPGFETSAPVYLLGRLKNSALSRRLRIKRPELRDDLGSLAFRTFDLLLLVLRNAHRDCETLVALFAKIFVKGHRGSFLYDANTIGLENLNARLSAPGRLARNIHMPRQSAEVRNFTASFITISGDGEVVGCLKTQPHEAET